VAHSVRRAAVTLSIAIPLAGCTSTQHEAQRERLDSARQRAALESTRVRVANTTVTASSIAEVRSAARTAFVVTVRNRGRKAVTDLPISLGYTTPAGASVYLNAAPNPDYFQAHLPAIAAGGVLTWVYTTDRRVPAAARPFARVGTKRAAPALLTEANIKIKVSYHYAGSSSLTVRLDNTTSVPQYQLQLYAFTTRGSKYVGAANATIATLGAGSKQSVRLGLVGTLGSQLRVQAVPTILQ
jgi:hypothetical protein